MPCTAKKTFEAAVQAQAHLIVQLKDNQPTLLQQTQAACTARAPLDANTTITEGRSRHETRTTEVFKPTKAGIGTEWQPLVKQIVRVSRNVLHRRARTGLWTSTSEVAYDLATTEASASRFAAAIRSHWHVENKLHYTRDVTFLEDSSRIRHNPGIFARVRSFAYNILRRNQNDTFNQDRYAAALGGLDAVFALTVS